MFMYRSRRLALACTALLGWVALPALPAPAAAQQPATQAPKLELFFHNPDVRNAQISPSGKHVALITRAGGEHYVVAVLPTSDPAQGKVIAGADSGDVVEVYWVNDERLVLVTSDLSGEQIHNSVLGGVLAINRDGSDLRALISGDWQYTQEQTGSQIKSRTLPARYTVLQMVHDGSDDILVGERDFNRVDRHLRAITPYRMNTRTLELHALVDRDLPDGAKGWMFDRDAQPRVFTAQSKGRRTVFYRDAGAKDWSTLGDFDANGDEGFFPSFFGYDGKLYVRAWGDKGTANLYRYDLQERHVETRPLIHLDGFDYGGSAEMDPQVRKVLGFHFLTDAHASAWLDPGMKKMQARIDQLLPGTVNTIRCGNCLGSPYLLVVAASDRDPARYLLYDTAKETLVQIGATFPGLAREQMGERNFFRYTSRDGLSIPVYVTTPPGKAAGPRPMVVLVHGGPWVRGTSWEWSAEPQFLASRGYVVLEPEFRGATGYGFPLFRAGWQQWGQAMQDDLADATKWAIDKGLADPKRIAIAGASYGGYATLMGLVRNPELFRCGFEWVGVTDLQLMFDQVWSDASDEAVEYGLPRLLGDPQKDAAKLHENSPIANAARLTQPILMAYGVQDRRVPLPHGTRMRDAVKAVNTQVEWIDYEHEGHGWFIEADRIDFWQHVEAFLRRNLAEAH